MRKLPVVLLLILLSSMLAPNAISFSTSSNSNSPGVRVIRQVCAHTSSVLDLIVTKCSAGRVVIPENFPAVFVHNGPMPELIVPKFSVTERQIRKWTFMVYLDADNNLEACGIDDFLEMAEVGSTNNVTIVVLFDRIDGYDDSYGNWTDTKLFVVEQGEAPYPENADEDWGECNMGDPQTLVNFVAWCVQHYPAEHYALILWDHGAALGGVCFDDTNGSDSLNLYEIRAALRTIHDELNVTIDVLGFDACLMGMLEVAYMCRDYVKYVVFSQETEASDGWPYNDILRALVVNPNMDPAEFAVLIAQKYVESYNNGSQGSDPNATQSAVNVSALVMELMGHLNQIVGELLRNYDKYSDAINYAAQNAETFSYSYSKDLKHFMLLLYDQVTDARLKSLIEAFLEAFNDTVLYSGHLSGHPNAYGLSIYISSYYSEYSQLDSSAHHQWDEFIMRYSGLQPRVWFYDITLAGSDTDGDSVYESVMVTVDMDTTESSAEFIVGVYIMGSFGEEFLGNYSVTLSGATSDDALTFTYSPPTTGLYSFRFVVYSQSSLVTQLWYYGDPDVSFVRMEVLPGYPVFTEILPSPSSCIRGVVRLQVNVTDETQVAWVKVKIDETWYDMTYNSTSGYWEHLWDTRYSQEGSVELTFNASDGENVTSIHVSYTVDNIEISIIEPSSGAKLSGVVTVRASIVVADGISFSAICRFIGEDSELSENLTYNEASGYYEARVNTCALPDGVYTLSILVNTNFSTSDSVAIKVIVDNYRAPILLVDDDQGDRYEAYYIEALEALGFREWRDFEVWDTLSDGNITYDVLANRTLVIWFTGDDWQSTLTDSERSAIAQYLASGGALFISGQDIGFDLENEAYDWYKQWLRAEYVADDAEQYTVFGLPGTVFEGASYNLRGSDSANNNYYPDIIRPYNGSFAILNYTDITNGSAAIAYNGSYRLVYFAFPFEAINGSSARADCLRRVIRFLAPELLPSIQVEITSPRNGACLNTTDVTVTWRASAAASLDHIEVRIDGGPWINVGLNTSYTFTGLSEGRHIVEVCAVDVQGRNATDSVEFWVDVTPPILEIVYPANNSVIEQCSVTIEWRCSDNVTKIKYVLLRIDYGDWIDVTRMTSFSTGELVRGWHIVELRAIDAAGNAKLLLLRFNISPPLPWVKIASPINGSVLNESVIEVTWEGWSAYSDYYYLIRLDNGEWIYVGRNTSASLQLSEGEYRIYVKLVEYGGAEALSTVCVVIDTTPPVIYVEFPENSSSLPEVNVTVEWSVSDALSGISYVLLRVDNGSWVNVTGVEDFTLMLLLPGRHVVEILAADRAGNVARTIVMFTVSPPEPTVMIVEPRSAWLNVSRVRVSWTYSSPYPVRDFRLRVDDGEWISLGVVSEYTLTLSEGNHTIVIMLVDYANRTCTDTSWVVVDLTAPTIAIVEPHNRSTVVTFRVTVRWDVSDNFALARVLLFVDHHLVADVTGLNSYEISLSDGTHIIQLVAIDHAGNAATCTVVVQVRFLMPVVCIVIAVVAIAVIIALRRKRES